MSAEVDIRVDHGGPGSAATVLVSGEIDLSNVDSFRDALDVDTPKLVVDLAGVTYIDSAGMGVLFARAARGPMEVRCEATSVVSPLIDITRLCDVAVIQRS